MKPILHLSHSQTLSNLISVLLQSQSAASWSQDSVDLQLSKCKLLLNTERPAVFNKTTILDLLTCVKLYEVHQFILSSSVITTGTRCLPAVYLSYYNFAIFEQLSAFNCLMNANGICPMSLLSVFIHRLSNIVMLQGIVDSPLEIGWEYYPCGAPALHLITQDSPYSWYLYNCLPAHSIVPVRDTVWLCNGYLGASILLLSSSTC